MDPIHIRYRDILTYTLVLLYESEGFAIEYHGTVTTGEPIQICVILNDYHLETVRLYLQDAEAMISLRNEWLYDEYQPLESVTSMDVDAFYEKFVLSDATNCIEASSDNWE